MPAQLCATRRDPADCSPPGSCVYGLLQARMLEWVAVFSSKGSPDPGMILYLHCRRIFFFFLTAELGHNLIA